MSGSFRSQRAAVAALFFVNGAMFATWVSRIPGVKEALGLSDSRLGVALLAIGLGTFSSLPLTSWMLVRRGSRAVVIGGALACCAGLPLAGAAPSLTLLVAALAIFGAALGTMDVAMNSQAALLERSAGRSMMSSFHGLWSLGGLVGASLGGGFASRGYSPGPHFVAVCVVLGLVVVAASRALVRDGGHRSAPAPLAWPSRVVLTIGLVGACGTIVEGGIADWSGVYLRDSLGTGVGTAASGFAAFSLAMTVGRFSGDRLIDRFGRRTMLLFGSTLTAVAIATALLAGRAPLAIAAFVTAGFGMCTVFPIAFGAAGRLPGATPGHAIAAVATMAYGAGLIAPPLIGFAAGATSLPAALGLLVLACLLIAALARSSAIR